MFEPNLARNRNIIYIGPVDTPLVKYPVRIVLVFDDRMAPTDG